MTAHLAQNKISEESVELVDRAYEKFKPVEPRILLDAVLDLDPGDVIAGGAENFLFAVAGSLDDQVAKLRETLDSFETDAGDALGAVGGLLDPTGASIGGDAGSGLRAAGELFDNVRTALGSALDQFEKNFDSFVSDNASTIASEINADLDDEFSQSNLLNINKVKEIFSFDTVTSMSAFENTVDTVIGTMFEQQLDDDSDVEADFQKLNEIVLGGLISSTTDALDDLFKINLTDIEVDGKVVVAFSDLDGEPQSDTDSVHVEVFAPDIEFDFASLFKSFGIDAEAFGADEISFSIEDFGFDFELTTSSGSDEFSITANEFEVGDPTFGGQLFDNAESDTDEDVNYTLNLGLLSAEITDFAFADFRLNMDGLDDLEFVASATFADEGVDFDVQATGADFIVGLEVQEVGADEFVNVVDDEAYKLVSTQVAGTLSLASGDEPIEAEDLVETNQTQRDFIIDLSLDGLVSTSQDNLATAFVDSLDVGFDIDLSSLGLEPEKEETLEVVISSLVGMGGQEIASALKSFAERVDEVLSSALLDFEIPFTSIGFSEAFEEIGSTIDSIVDAFSIDLIGLGFATPIELFSNGGVLISGEEIDPSGFDGIGSFELVDVDTGETLATVISENDEGGFASVEELVEAINNAFNLTGSELDLVVHAVEGGLTFSLLGSAEADIRLGFGDAFGVGELSSDEVATELRALLGFPELTVMEFNLEDLGERPSRFGTEIDLSQFIGVGSFTLVDYSEVDFSDESEENSTEGVIIEIISPNGEGGFNTLEELRLAIETALANAGEGYNADVEILDGALNFSLPHGSLDQIKLSFGDILDTSGEAISGLDLGDLLGFEAFSDLSLSFEQLSASIEKFDMDALNGASRLVFALFDGTTERSIEAATVDEEGNALSLAEIIDNINLALPDESFSLTLSDSGEGIDFELDEGVEGAFRFGIDEANQFLGLTLDTLLAFGNEKLDEVLPGAGLALDDAGRLQFLLPEFSAEVGFDNKGFAFSDLGLDLIGGFDISAEITGSVEAAFSTNFAIDFGQFAGDALTLLNDRAKGGGAESAVSLNDSLFLQNTELSGHLIASANNIAGEATLGFVTAEFGQNDASQNFINLDAQLEATLVGQDDEGEFSSSIAFSQISEAVRESKLDTLLGRIELAGGLIVNEDGSLVDDALVSNDDIFNAELEEGQISALAVLRFGDVSIDVAGIGGLTEDAIDGVYLVLPDIFDTSSFIVEIDSPYAAALTGLNSGDILDTLSNIGSLLGGIGEALADDLPFLATDIPVLNFNVLDVIDFGTAFIDGLKDFRNNPADALSGVEDALEEVFGDDTVDITYDADEFILGFNLNFDIVDGGFSTALAIDLVALLGEQLNDIVGEEASEFLTGLVDARGDASLVIDPKIGLDIAFGIDLSSILEEPSTIASTDTALALMATASVVTGAITSGRPDLRITRTDVESGKSTNVEVTLADQETLGDALNVLNAALANGFGEPIQSEEDGPLVSIEFDAESGILTLVDLDATAVARAQGVDALFGEEAGDAEEGDEGFQVIGSSDINGIDFGSSFAFDVVIDDERATVSIAEDAGRTDLESFLNAASAALNDASIARSSISDTSIAGTKISLGQLFTLSVEDGGDALILASTNFAEANGFEQFTFGVDGVDVSLETKYKIEGLDGSNIDRLLGFKSNQLIDAGDVSSQVLLEALEDEQVRLFLDTENTGLNLSLTAGAEDINVVLGAGPIEINVVGGKALINAGDGSGDPARFNLSINDVDGDDNEGQFDLSSLGSFLNDPANSFLDLFSVDTAIGLDVVLPFSDSLGLFDPASDGLTYVTDLLKTDLSVSLNDFSLPQIGNFFGGSLVDHQQTGSFDFGDIDFSIPDLSEFLADINVLDILNDPKALLEGLDLILETLDKQVVDFLDDLNLPLIGDKLSYGVTIFQDLRFDVIEPALAFASTPDENGRLPTTVGLLTGLLNDKINELFDTEDQTYISAFLDTSGALNDSFLGGALSFSGELFSEALDIGFDLGIPGFELEVEEGTEIKLSANFDANIAFGIDKYGLFLLNDTDEEEISVVFDVDADNFEGSFEVAGLLSATATAIDPNVINDDTGFVEVPDFEETFGNVGLHAKLGLDLFGESGSDVERDYSELELTKHSGGDVVDIEYEKILRLNEISFSELAEITFEAGADLNLLLVGEIINPVTGDAIDTIPSVATELIIDIDYDLENGLQIQKMVFENLRLDASSFYESFIEPIIVPFEPFLDAFATIADIFDIFPLNLALDAIEIIFPVVGLVQDIIDLADSVNAFVDTLQETGGFVVFGDYDFSNVSADLASGSISSSSIKFADLDFDPTAAIKNLSGSFGKPGKSIAIDVPLFTDPSNALSLILGDFESVDLVTATFSLINIPAFDIDIVQTLIEELSIPEALGDIISDVFMARIYGEAFVGFQVGYDLSGVVNFLNTYDAVRLLDGIFLQSGLGTLVDFEFGAEIELDIDLGFIGAGISTAFELFFELGFNDPNRDGKLRIPEMFALIEQAVGSENFIEFIETVFVGNAGFQISAFLNAFIKLGPVEAGFDIEVFDVGHEINFGGLPITPKLTNGLSDGGTAILNVGSRISESLSDEVKDGDDTITISGPNSPVEVNVTSGRSSFGGSIENVNSVIIPAGEGNNTVDLSAVTTIPTLTFTGSGEDRIILPNQGFHVVFSGGGKDTITTGQGATGTYWIFSEDGSDVINTAGGDTLVFAADEFGLRDAFIAEFRNGGYSQSAAEALLADQLNKKFGKTLDEFVADFTVETQVTANKDADQITVSSGKALILAGGGDDSIVVGDGSDQVTIIGGAGNDRIQANGTDVFIEGGAGGDLIEIFGGDARIFGYGEALGIDGITDDEAINTLSIRDGDDVILSGSGNDEIFGQRGDNIISAGLGDDFVHGGRGDDIVTGGQLVVHNLEGASIDLTTLIDGLSETVIIENNIEEDGDDILYADGGENLVIGGGGGDEIYGGIGSSILIGDFSAVELSSNQIAQGITATGVGNLASGTDTITGGSGNDILIGGGADEGEIETLIDVSGSNIIIGDSADIEGSRILEKVSVVRSVADTTGNDDVIMGGPAFDILFGGEGNDTITAVLGSNIIAGDNAIFSRAGGTGLLDGRGHGEFYSISSDLAGNDSINIPDAGNPAPGDFQPKQLVIVGDGDDNVTLGDGGHTVMGDDGLISFDPIILETLQDFQPFIPGSGELSQEDIDKQNESLETIASFEDVVLHLTAVSPHLGGVDTINTGAGNDVIVGGAAGDIITSGSGDDVVAGDWVTITTPPTDVDGIGRITSDNFEVFGDDIINTGEGDDLIIGGRGDDLISASSGFDTALGDNGTVEFIKVVNVETILLTDVENGGDDILTVSGAGDSILIGQSGDDSITGGDDDDILIGDLALITLLPTGTFDLEESHVERVSNLEYFGPEFGAEDIINGGSGRDIILGGFGDDILNGEEGQDIIAGDSFLIERLFLANLDGTMVSEEFFFDSNYAFDVGGYDQLTGGDGADIVVGHLGPDLFFGNTRDDFLLGDSASFYAKGPFTETTFEADRFLEILSVNFPGFGANDVLSSSQVDASAGISLGDPNDKKANNIVNFAGDTLDEDALRDTVQSRSSALFLQIVNVVNSEKIWSLISSFEGVDISPELLMEIIKDAVLSNLLSIRSDNIDQLLLERMIEKVLSTTIEELLGEDQLDEVIDKSA